jgi:hypothetical protein
LTTTLLLSSYGYPILECISSNKLKGLDAYGAVLGVIQTSVLWLGSLSLYEISALSLPTTLIGTPG